MSDQLTMRDTFAAAALNGWLASQQTVINQYTMARKAYEYADAMLLERERTNHDAAPAARGDDRECADHVTTGGTLDRDVEPATTAHSSGNDGVRPDSHGTGDTHEPAAWAVIVAGKVDSEGGSDALFTDRDDAVYWASDHIIANQATVVPLYREPQPTLTDAEREAVEAGEQFCLSATGERMAPRDYIQANARFAATLRGLLERTGGVK